MKSNLKKIAGCIFIILVIITMGISLRMVFSYFVNKVESQFGHPTDQLDQSQQLLYSMRLFLKMDKMLEHRISEGDGMVFSVNEGETPDSIADRMMKENLISDTSSFIDLLVYPKFVDFSFLAGWRWEEIANLLPDSGLEIDMNDFKSAVQTSEIPFLNSEENGNFGIEGYLSPGDYLISRSATADEIIQLFTDKFMEVLPGDFEEKAFAQKLKPHEVVILASIVQKETILSAEAPLIASVFLNRLQEGIPLQSDPTVQYALGYYEAEETWWRTQLSAEDLVIKSPFNTYLVNGLTPAPICNPGLEVIQAVLQPENSPYLYFRAACDESGRHLFSETYEEHLEKSCKK